MSDERPATVSQLKSLSPLDGMKADNLTALSKKVMVRSLSAGHTLFKQGERDKLSFWVISGLVEIRENERTVAMIRGGSAEARTPLAPGQPRKYTARVVEQIEFISIDRELLDVMIVWDQTGTYEVADLRSAVGGSVDDDWMTTLLSSSSFQRIPPSNIQAIFMRMQRQAYRSGEVIIKQGDEGDFFYAIVSGKVLVTRETPLNKNGIKLAELNPGETFGEEALIAEAKRNATVRMLTDGVLMRLSKQDFRELMNEPLVHFVDYAQAQDLVVRGARWLDVRLPSEFQNLRIEDSLNVPLYFIRLKLSALDKNTPYVVCCDTGRRSAAAAYILVEKGFEAYVLEGGITQAHVKLRHSA